MVSKSQNHSPGVAISPLTYGILPVARLLQLMKDGDGGGGVSYQRWRTSWRLDFISCLYSATRSFLPSTKQVRFGLGLTQYSRLDLINQSIKFIQLIIDQLSITKAAILVSAGYSNKVNVL